MEVQQQAVFQAILNEIEMGVVVADRDPNCTFINPAAEKILGAGLAAVPLRDWARHCGLFQADGVTPLPCEQLPLLRAIHGETVAAMEIFVRGPQGGNGTWVGVSARPLQAPLGGMMVCGDISARRKAEEERDCFHAAWQRRGGELEVLNKELEALAYSISHDLRAPLRHINAFATLLGKEAGPALSKDATEFLEIISQSAHAMSGLLDHLLVFSRLGRAEMAPQEIDLNAMLEDVLVKLLRETEGRNIRWMKHSLPKVQADATMMQEVFMNLLANAIKFTRGRNPAEIEIGCREAPDEAVIFVRDNGVGFDMQYADKLFGIFQRLHRAEDFEGVGLGLASVRRMLARHGGRTWAEAKVNAGAAFYFSLPKCSVAK